jgi:hypothetical protein
LYTLEIVCDGLPTVDFNTLEYNGDVEVDVGEEVTASEGKGEGGEGGKGKGTEKAAIEKSGTENQGAEKPQTDKQLSAIDQACATPAHGSVQKIKLPKLKYVHAWSWLPWNQIKLHLFDGSTCRDKVDLYHEIADVHRESHNCY